VAWQKARELTVEIYRISSSGRFASDRGLRNQIQRATVSVMSNIAEGFERYSRQEFKQYLSVARGSAAEVRSQLFVALDLGYIGRTEFEPLYQRCVELSRLIGGMRASLDESH
ncbi:MAG: four helix bundle protein, partial [Pseudomonadota bacterium]|nr:four helix bundle protein [Pseudomonadota bacterium]